MQNKVITMGSSAALLTACLSMSGFFAATAFAGEQDFAGQWMIQIDAPGVVPYRALLEIEEGNNEWVAYVENGPAPLKINGNKIEIEVDSRDRQGFRFQRLLEGELKNGELSGILHSIDILKSAAEYGEDGASWTAVRPDMIAPRKSSNYSLEDYGATWVGIRGVDVRKYTMDMTPAAKVWLSGYDARMDEAQKR